MPISRRQFLRAAASASAVALAPTALDALCARLAQGAALASEGYGPLGPDPAGLLDLPAGFSYRALSSAREGATADPRFTHRLTNGDLVPALHDGMGAFPGPNGVTVLVRNHEVKPGQLPIVDEARVRPYDRLGRGGTTTLWVDAERNVLRAFASLSGSMRNCAGGVTPWGSWLSAEECTYMPGALDPVNQDLTPDVAEPHGYVFEVDARAESLVEPRPIRGMGRFYHEAVAVDPATGFVYLSEDRDDGLFYRYRPHLVTRRSKRPHELGVGDLAQGGVLEALAIAGRPSATTQNWGTRMFAPREPAKIAWLAIPDPEPAMDMERDPDDAEPDPLRKKGRTARSSTRAQGFAIGAAQFARTEGVLYHKGAIYLCCTNGGTARFGQVWRLDGARQTIELLFEPDDQALIDGPDNLTAAPNGDLIVCEDGKADNFVVGITRDGRFYHLARNAYNRSEFAGACFAPDGRTLFVNMQNPGVTYAIQGPWRARA